MIRVTVDLLPGGDASRARTIGTAEICNVSDLADVSNYVARVRTPASESLGIMAYEDEFGIAEHHRRGNVCRLLARVFGTAVSRITEREYAAYFARL